MLKAQATASDFNVVFSGTNAFPSNFAGSETGTKVDLIAGQFQVGVLVSLYRRISSTVFWRLQYASTEYKFWFPRQFFGV
jgi:hypothetical protein